MARENMFVSIEYDEAAAAPTYERISVTRLGGEVLASWATGNPAADWNSFVAWAGDRRERLLMTSSVGHFVFDVEGYRWTEGEDGIERLVEEETKASPSA